MSDESCFTGPTKPGFGIYDLAFDASGALYMLDTPGLAAHRRGEKKPATLGGPELGGTRGIAASTDLVAVGTESSVVLLSGGGTVLTTIAGRPSGVAVSADGQRVAIGLGAPGDVEQRVEVRDRAGALVCEVGDEAVRNGTEGLAFTTDGSQVLLVAGGRLVTIQVASGEVRVGPALRDEFQLSARRMAVLGDAALVIFAGRGAQWLVGAAIVDLEGRPRWIGGEADGAAASHALGLAAIVKGASVELRDPSGALVRSASRAKATHVLDGVALSHDGWLALASGAKSGAHAKAAELLRV
ncbi:MAG: hypothetical protein K1X94_25785 [Sandaracinaceae bacterium]|nr:hypothetical protein [Sandaracinaceae bacterium]